MATVDDGNLLPNRAAAPAPGGGRRKGSAIRAWLVVSDRGRSYLEEVGKHAIMRRTGLPARDLRMLDPLLSYPSTILGRERAIVINLEHIKAIITATEVLVPNSKDPLVAPFIHDLQSRVAVAPFSASAAGAAQQATRDGGNAGLNDRVTSPSDHDGGIPASSYMVQVLQDKNVNPLDMPKDGEPKTLPFEFRVLEVCLESACRCLESETSTLEQEAYPALDELTSKISTLNLERVRQIKSRLVAISGRVQKVRDELEHLLDDDMDMAEMYLTEKLDHQRFGEREVSLQPGMDNDNASEAAAEVDNDDDVSKNESESSEGTFTDFKPNIEELEMLLEAYFVQIDGTLNKLSALREYVDDTEDYINIMLDEKQNQLLEMGVMLSTATLVCSAGIVVVSIFGMNIGIELYNGSGSTKFWETAFGTVGACLILYFIAIGWGRKSGLLQ